MIPPILSPASETALPSPHLLRVPPERELISVSLQHALDDRIFRESSKIATNKSEVTHVPLNSLVLQKCHLKLKFWKIYTEVNFHDINIKCK